MCVSNDLHLPSHSTQQNCLSLVQRSEGNRPWCKKSSVRFGTLSLFYRGDAFPLWSASFPTNGSHVCSLTMSNPNTYIYTCSETNLKLVHKIQTGRSKDILRKISCFNQCQPNLMVLKTQFQSIRVMAEHKTRFQCISIYIVVLLITSCV